MSQEALTEDEYHRVIASGWLIRAHDGQYYGKGVQRNRHPPAPYATKAVAKAQITVFRHYDATVVKVYIVSGEP